MKMVQSTFGFKEYNAAMKKLIAQFDKNPYDERFCNYPGGRIRFPHL